MLYTPEEVLTLSHEVDAQLDQNAKHVHRVQQRGNQTGALRDRRYRTNGGGDASGVSAGEGAMGPEIAGEAYVGQGEDGRRCESVFSDCRHEEMCAAGLAEADCRRPRERGTYSSLSKVP